MQSDAAPQARRRARTAERLREALARLLRDGSRRPTVAALAREAGVGRNAIYANHNTILDELRHAVARRGTDSQRESDADRGLEHRRVIAERRINSGSSPRKMRRSSSARWMLKRTRHGSIVELHS